MQMWGKQDYKHKLNLKHADFCGRVHEQPSPRRRSKIKRRNSFIWSLFPLPKEQNWPQSQHVVEEEDSLSEAFKPPECHWALCWFITTKLPVKVELGKCSCGAWRAPPRRTWLHPATRLNFNCCVTFLRLHRNHLLSYWSFCLENTETEHQLAFWWCNHKSSEPHRHTRTCNCPRQWKSNGKRYSCVENILKRRERNICFLLLMQKK